LSKHAARNLGKMKNENHFCPKTNPVTLASNAIFLRLVCKKKKWLHTPLFQASTKFQPRI
jgi:hypothetical protein